MAILQNYDWGKLATNFLEGLSSGVVGLGLSTIGNIIGSSTDNSSWYDQAQYAYALQEQSAQNAYERQLDFWNKQNAYNDPSQQIKRLQQAGLNPALLNGGVQGNTAGTLSSVSSGSSPASPQGRQPSPSQFLGTFTSMLAQIEQMGYLDEQTKYMYQQVLNAKLETEIKQIAKELGLSEAEIAKLNYKAVYEAYYGHGLDGGDTTIPNNPYSVDISYRRALTNESVEMLQHKIDNLVANSDYIAAKKECEKLLSSAEYMLKKEQTASERQRTANIYADTLLKHAETTYKETLDRTANSQEARNAAMHELNLRTETLRQNNIISDTTAKDIDNAVRKVVDLGNVDNAGEAGMFLFSHIKDILKAAL